MDGLLQMNKRLLRWKQNEIRLSEVENNLHLRISGRKGAEKFSNIFLETFFFRK